MKILLLLLLLLLSSGPVFIIDVLSMLLLSCSLQGKSTKASWEMVLMQQH
jgi:hypothetical protein